MKVYNMGEPVDSRTLEPIKVKRSKKGRFTSIRSRVRRFVAHIKWMGKTIAFIAIGAAFLVFAGTFTMTSDEIRMEVSHVYASKMEKEKAYTVLDAIADCESGARMKNGKAVKWSARQFDANGQVVKYVNRKGDYIYTVDVGYYGINVDIWGKKAGELGYNVYTEEGNKAFAKWLYAKQGTAPWNSSKSCWEA